MRMILYFLRLLLSFPPTLLLLVIHTWLVFLGGSRVFFSGLVRGLGSFLLSPVLLHVTNPYKLLFCVSPSGLSLVGVCVCI